MREVLEETGYDCDALLPKDSKDYIELSMMEQKIRLYIVPGVDEDYPFETQTRKEISKIQWWKLTDLPTWQRKKKEAGSGRFYLISPFVPALRAWIQEHKSKHPRRPVKKQDQANVTEILQREENSSPAPPKKPEQVPNFPDPSSLFPTFVGAGQSPRNSNKRESLASAEGGENVLKAMLGLGASPQTATAVAAKPAHDATPGIGARMIEAQGDERGKQLLSLLQGNLGGLSGALEGPTVERKLSEQEAGAASLLAALHAGAGNSGSIQSRASHSWQSAQDQGNTKADANQYQSTGQPQARRDFPPQQENSLRDAPLPAPQAQRTGQAKALLELITPQKPTFDVVQVPAKGSQGPALSTMSQQAPPTSADATEQQREVQRNLLLSRLMSAGAEEVLSPKAQAGDQGVTRDPREQALLAALGPQPAAHPQHHLQNQPHNHHQHHQHQNLHPKHQQHHYQNHHQNHYQNQQQNSPPSPLQQHPGSSNTSGGLLSILNGPSHQQSPPMQHPPQGQAGNLLQLLNQPSPSMAQGQAATPPHQQYNGPQQHQYYPSPPQAHPMMPPYMNHPMHQFHQSPPQHHQQQPQQQGQSVPLELLMRSAALS